MDRKIKLLKEKSSKLFVAVDVFGTQAAVNGTQLETINNHNFDKPTGLDDDGKTRKLSSGEVAGIVAGAITFCFVFFGGLFTTYRKTNLLNPCLPIISKCCWFIKKPDIAEAGTDDAGHKMIDVGAPKPPDLVGARSSLSNNKPAEGPRTETKPAEGPRTETKPVEDPQKFEEDQEEDSDTALREWFHKWGIVVVNESVTDEESNERLNLWVDPVGLLFIHSIYTNYRHLNVSGLSKEIYSRIKRNELYDILTTGLQPIVQEKITNPGDAFLCSYGIKNLRKVCHVAGPTLTLDSYNATLCPYEILTKAYFNVFRIWIDSNINFLRLPYLSLGNRYTIQEFANITRICLLRALSQIVLCPDTKAKLKEKIRTNRLIPPQIKFCIINPEAKIGTNELHLFEAEATATEKSAAFSGVSDDLSYLGWVNAAKATNAEGSSVGAQPDNGAQPGNSVNPENGSIIGNGKRQERIIGDCTRGVPKCNIPEYKDLLKDALSCPSCDFFTEICQIIDKLVEDCEKKKSPKIPSYRKFISKNEHGSLYCYFLCKKEEDEKFSICYAIHELRNPEVELGEPKTEILEIEGSTKNKNYQERAVMECVMKYGNEWVIAKDKGEFDPPLLKSSFISSSFTDTGGRKYPFKDTNDESSQDKDGSAEVPFVMFFGEPDSGKSALVEKLQAQMAYVQGASAFAEYFRILDDIDSREHKDTEIDECMVSMKLGGEYERRVEPVSLVTIPDQITICNTPGTSVIHKMGPIRSLDLPPLHALVNLWEPSKLFDNASIHKALKAQPLSKIVIVVNGADSLNRTYNLIKLYDQIFADFPPELLCVCINTNISIDNVNVRAALWGAANWDKGSWKKGLIEKDLIEKDLIEKDLKKGLKEAKQQELKTIKLTEDNVFEWNNNNVFEWNINNFDTNIKKHELQNRIRNNIMNTFANRSMLFKYQMNDIGTDDMKYSYTTV